MKGAGSSAPSVYGLAAAAATLKLSVALVLSAELFILLCISPFRESASIATNHVRAPP